MAPPPSPGRSRPVFRSAASPQRSTVSGSEGEPPPTPEGGRAEEGGGASHRTCQLGFIQFRCFSVDLEILKFVT